MANLVTYKTDGETLPLVQVDFTDLLTGDTSITSGSTVTATDTAGVDQSSAVIANKTQSGMILSADLKSGTNGEDYKVIFHAIGTTTAKPREVIIELRVRNTIVGTV